MQSVSQYLLIAKFQLSSAASLNMGWSQNGVSGMSSILLYDFEKKSQTHVVNESTESKILHVFLQSETDLHCNVMYEHRLIFYEKKYSPIFTPRQAEPL